MCVPRADGISASTLEDQCKPGGSYNNYNPPPACTASYCDQYKPTGWRRAQCTPGAYGHHWAASECQATCGLTWSYQNKGTCGMSREQRQCESAQAPIEVTQGRCEIQLPDSTDVAPHANSDKPSLCVTSPKLPGVWYPNGDQCRIKFRAQQFRMQTFDVADEYDTLMYLSKTASRPSTHIGCTGHHGGLNANNQWMTCDDNAGMTGLRRGAQDYLNNIYNIFCCKQAEGQTCTDEPAMTGGDGYDQKWVKCPANTYLGGLYRGDGTSYYLANLRKFRCCSHGEVKLTNCAGVDISSAFDNNGGGRNVRCPGSKVRRAAPTSRARTPLKRERRVFEV